MTAQLDPTRPPLGAGVAGVAPAPEQPIARRSGAGGLLSSLAAVVRDVRYPPALYLEFTARQTPVRTHQSVSVRPVVGGTVPRHPISPQ